MIDKPVVAALKRMRRLLDRGWIQGRLSTDKGYCLLGAWTAETENGSRVRRSTGQIIDRLIGHSGWPAWNDAKGRTKRHVLALIDKAIRRAEA